MINLLIEQKRIPQLLEDKIMCPQEEYWTVDLDSNDLIYDPNALKKALINETIEYLDTPYKIIGIEFYSKIRTKIVLIVKREEC